MHTDKKQDEINADALISALEEQIAVYRKLMHEKKDSHENMQLTIDDKLRNLNNENGEKLKN